MVLKDIYLLPHGDEIIDIPDDESAEMNRAIGKVVRRDAADVLAIASPHGVRLSKNIAVVNTERFDGSFELQTRNLNRKLFNERELAESILSHAPDETEELGFVTSAGDKSVFPMDFGTLIPLEFFPDKPIVYLGQSRLTDRNKLRNFGANLYDALEEYDKNVSLIVSADQAHTHSDKGPYGYSSEAKEYEKIILDCIRSNDYSALLEIKEDMISDAKPDSYWNLVMLSSLLEKSNRKLEFDYHYVEIYYGMICAHSYA